MRRYSAFHSICHRQKNGQRSIFHIISLRSVLTCLDLLCLLSRMNGRVCLKHRHTHTQSNKGKSYQYVIAAMSWRRAADTHILYACVFSLTEPNVWMADDKHHLSSDIRDDRERQQKILRFFLSLTFPVSAKLLSVFPFLLRSSDRLFIGIVELLTANIFPTIFYLFFSSVLVFFSCTQLKVPKLFATTICAWG